MEGGYTKRDIKQPIFLTEPQGFLNIGFLLPFVLFRSENQIGFLMKNSEQP